MPSQDGDHMEPTNTETPPLTGTTGTATITSTVVPGNSTSPKPLSIIVASKNPVKIRAAHNAFIRMFPPPSGTSTTVSTSIFPLQETTIVTSSAGTTTPAWHTVRGVSVSSGVPDQPISDAETLLGARNRAERARELEPGADYWVGIEGGVDFDPEDETEEMMRSFAWVVVLGPRAGSKLDAGENGMMMLGKARTATYYLPRETSRLVKGGMELGHADEVMFGGRNSKQKNGSVGLLTGDVIDRGGYYEEAVVLALIPFRNPGLTF
ncbi:Maf/Ham1 [Parathielavia appendiculata]|uniref:inosine/xanthosine triphosphatase n=1 Tax=Parathielavia appendiculata TaxID=2587402 RepID=A0AAN6U342_9PEZI|nr:Maf/Ham1 [Parathielavia appendiculata]